MTHARRLLTLTQSLVYAIVKLSTSHYRGEAAILTFEISDDNRLKR